MRFIFAGQTGVKKEFVLKALHDETTKRLSGGKIRVYCIEDEIKEITKAPSLLPYLESSNETYKRDQWLKAFTNILEKEQREKPFVSFLSLHLSFQRKSRFFSPLVWSDAISLFREWEPGKIVTLIDDIYLVKRRIQPGTRVRLRELSTWRNIEILMADILAREIFPSAKDSYPSYSNSPVVAIKHPPKMLYKLLFDDSKEPKVYACIPISKARTDLSGISEINSYLRDLHEHFIVFDPLTIDERPMISLIGALLKEDPRTEVVSLNKEDRWSPTEDCTLYHNWDEYPIELDVQEIREIAERFQSGDKSEIDRNIELRDLRLIDQSNFLIVYRPFYRGSTLSTGMRSEILYAKDVKCCPIRFIHDPDVDGEFQQEAFGIEMLEMFKNLADLVKSVQRR